MYSGVTVMKIKFQDSTIPYPLSILKGRLELSGASDKVVAEVIMKLTDKKIETVTLTESNLVSFVNDRLEEEQPEISQAFNTIISFERLRRLNEQVPPIIIVLEGASATGKSMIALNLNQAISSTRFISTDTIRQVLRNIYSAEEYPELHCHTYQAFKYCQSGAEHLDPIVRGYIAQCDLLTPQITNLVKRIISEGADAVIEGVHIQPGTLQELNKGILEIVINPSQELHRTMFVSKNEMGRLRSVTSDKSVREEEFTSTRMIQEFMTRLAKEHNISVIELEDYEQAHREINQLILTKMSQLIELHQ